MNKCLHTLLAILLCSCGSITQTKDPAAAYNATQVYRERDGTLQVCGDWAFVYASTTAEVPVMVATGIKGRVKGGQCAYSIYTVVGKGDRGGAAVPDMESVTMHVRELPYSRATLDQAAAGAGLTMALPEWRTSHTFSAAYVRGVLQKIDAALRNSSSVKIKQISLPWQYER